MCQLPLNMGDHNHITIITKDIKKVMSILFSVEDDG